MTTASEPLGPGSLCYDPATAKVGEYRDRAGPYVMLRPVGGGREWEADPDTLRPATNQERLGASVRAANHRSAAVPSLSPPPEQTGRPPRAVPGCGTCAGLAGRRETARAAYDRSAETDANVLLRQHQREEHRA
ncbi:hypothetical protein AB0N17_29220 [Streptomyces sp. NPDC051133]|uniref:hypothetical protein n=1 Tax=Streptomyces sp. NPDC051133 TaxID=3155521 RepID=UPI00343FF8C1